MDYYEVLGISSNASNIDIKKAYHKQAFIWHPDKHSDSDKKTATKKFQLISEAYQVLSDESCRSEYDRNGKSNMKLKSADDLFNEVFSNMDPIISTFLKNTFSDLKTTFDTSEKISIWDLFTNMDKDRIIEEGGNVVKHILKQSLTDTEECITDNKFIYDLKLDIDEIDECNTINLTIDSVRRFTHINLNITNKNNSNDKKYLLDMGYDEHIVNYLGKSYIFYLADKFPDNYKRYNDYDIILEHEIHIKYRNIGYYINNEYEEDNTLNMNIMFKYKSNIVKILGKGILNKRTKKYGNLYIIFTFINTDERAPNYIKIGAPTYDNLDPYEFINKL